MTKLDAKELKEIFHEPKKISINFKLLVAMILAGIIALGAFFLMGLVNNAIVSGIAKSESLKGNEVNDRFESLESTIKNNNLIGSDTEELQKWLKHEPYTEIILSDRTGDIFTGGFTTDSGNTYAPITGAGSGGHELKVDLSKKPEDLYNREIRFLDKNYYVYINVYMEYRWKGILNGIRLLLTAILFLALVLVYNRRVLNRVIKLSDEVNLISAGELDREIEPGERDEIGTLARDVDTMRTSILENISSEKAAWDANAQLITSMSHDIRTPLTSLIGYLDIIAGHKYKNEEELQKYIGSCSDKAVQLKDLSDKLFQYFLVYNNNQAQDRELETLDAGILFQQFMIEHVSELTQYDYQVNLVNNIPENVMIDTETSAMQRLFDNLFSNIMKYADKGFPIEIRADVNGSQIKIVIENHIAEVAKKVESTKIGVKTCKKIVEDLSGTFHALEDDERYVTEIIFNIKEMKEGAENDVEGSGSGAGGIIDADNIDAEEEEVLPEPSENPSITDTLSLAKAELEAQEGMDSRNTIARPSLDSSRTIARPSADPAAPGSEVSSRDTVAISKDTLVKRRKK